MSIRIMKSSAGAGKTFNLAKTYIRLLLGSDDIFAYRHILAVTFTNKATAEMKNRILKELDILASNPGKSPYIEDFSKEFGSRETVRKRSQNVLRLILHDYGAFSVSTIDHFFQNALRSFARELGRFPDYQVDLDKDSLVRESVDRVLDSVGDNPSDEIRGWLLKGALDQIDDRGSLHLEKGLYEMAGKIGNENYRSVIEKNSIDTEESYSRKNLEKTASGCRKVIAEFKKNLKDSASRILGLLEREGLAFEDFSHSNWFPQPLLKYASGDRTDCPSASFLSRCHSAQEWFTKKSKRMPESVSPELLEATEAFALLFEGEKYRLFQTANMLVGQLYSLGLTGEFGKSLQALMNEKNVISLDESNLTLREIIAGSDAPFIYEKLGVRYENFLLDEFQDTSPIQWENFKPLLAESSASGFENLLVGDVKQSIYRFRGGDWQLLSGQVKKDFPLADDKAPLKENWRSLRAIVEYNNAFFAYAAQVIDGLLSEASGQEGESVARSIYADVAQEPKTTDPAPGFVKISYCDPEDEIKAVLESVREGVGAGAEYRQIAILVRNNNEGSEIALALASDGIPVISDDSMKVKSAVTIHRLTALLTYASDGNDPVGKFLAGRLGVEVPEEYDSLFDVSESLLRALERISPGQFAGEIPYIQAFMDELLSWTGANGNSLQQFLEYWNDNDPKISSPESANAVRVITIHKAKGLEFPYVIFPFAEKVTLFKMTSAWCCPAVEGTEMEDFGRNAYNINISGKLKGSLFEKDYLEELRLQYIDNLNIFYVAMTRAVNVLHVICAEPKTEKISTMADILAGFEKNNNPGHGQMYDFRASRAEALPEITIPSVYPSYPLNEKDESGEDVRVRGRLKFRSEAVDFFLPDGETGPSARLKGIVLHKILSSCNEPEDLPAAIDNAYLSGLIDSVSKKEYETFLRSAISSVSDKGWFAPGLKVLGEQDILDTDGSVYRPDRVVLGPDGKVAVIDYKFGSQRPSYRRQVANYCRLYRDMGYSSVTGWIWYVAEGICESAG